MSCPSEFEIFVSKWNFLIRIFNHRYGFEVMVLELQ